MVTHLVDFLTMNLIVTKNICNTLKGTQRHLWKKALFFQYDDNNNTNLIFETLPIKHLPKYNKVTWSLISLGIKQSEFSNTWRVLHITMSIEVHRGKELNFIGIISQFNTRNHSI